MKKKNCIESTKDTIGKNIKNKGQKKKPLFLDI